MKRISVLIGVAVIAVVLAAIFIRQGNLDSDSVKIGVVLPLSGSMAEYGQNGRDGLMLASEELARTPEMRKFSLLYQDTKEAPQDTVAAVRRLIDVDKVRFIIGGLTSSGVLAAAPYAQQHGVLFFTPAASAPGIPEIGDMIFRNWPADDAIATKYGQAIFKRGVKTVAILSVSNDYGQTNANGFAAAFEKAGGSVVFRRSFPQGTTDFRALATQLSALPPFDRLLVIGYPDEYRAFFQELAKSPVTPATVLATDTFYSPTLVAEIGKLAEGVIVAAAAKPSDDFPPRKAFIDSYESRFKTPDGKPRPPGLVSDTAYDALKLVVSAISKTDGTPKAVSQYLLQNTKDYPGASGITSFTAVGDVTASLALYQVRSGIFVEIGP